MLRFNLHPLQEDYFISYRETFVFPIQNGVKTRRCFNANAFQVCLRTCHYETMKVMKNQAGLTLNGRHKLLVYTDDVNLLGDNTEKKEKHCN